LIENALHFEMDGDKIKNLVYEPSFYDYFKEHNIDFKQKLVDLLIKTKFNQRLSVNEQEIKEIIDHLPFRRKIIFNYRFGIIEIEYSTS